MSHKVFVTGSTGYVGGAIALRLARAGHEVYGLTRHPERAAGLDALGIKPVVGEVAEPDTYVGILKNCDVAVHALYDATDTAGRDQRALESYRNAAQDGRVRRLLYTSGFWVHGATGDTIVDESAPLHPLAAAPWRPHHEEIALDLADDEVDVIVFRPPIVYGESRGIIGDLFAEAREHHTVTLFGDGQQHWDLVHRDDVAEAYHLALQYAEGGQRYLLGDESHFTHREIGEAIARTTGATLQTLDAATVKERLGAYGEALLNSSQVSAAKARRELGWVPRHTSFVNEVDALFREWQGEQTPVR